MQTKKIDLHEFFIKSQQAIEFTKLLQILSEFAVTQEAKSIIINLLNQKLIANPEDKLELVQQAKDFILIQEIPLGNFNNISNEIQFLKIENFHLTMESIKNLYLIIINVERLSTLKKSNKLKELPLLNNFISELPELSNALKYIQQIFDSDFEIRDNASKELLNIRNSIRSYKKVIYQTFKKELEFYRGMGILAEGEESVRNGRYVLRIQVEHKRKVKGIIVDESDSGKTLFIEPQVCLEQNNEIVQLELNEKREISKILLDLTSKLRVYSGDFELAYQKLLEIDVLLAKARFALKLNAVKPIISKNKSIKIRNAFHPLLLLKFLNSERTPESLDILLDETNYLLLISGPNAGGKTIVLKTLGLLQFMLQKGILIPVDKNSQFTIFKDIWVDIGDWQSLDEGLSTYSARLNYMKIILENVSDQSLVLLDELGSGTEPIIGGAIAESVLSDLVKKNVYGVITTHYINLKSFAHNTSGIINGAMVYDEKNMEPKYKLQIGKPGSSYALDIANKLRFPKHLIHYAKQKSGKNVVNLETLISKLEQEKQTLENTNKEYLLKITSLNKLIKAYEDIQKQYELKRLKLKLESKEFEFQKLQKQKDISNKLIEEIRSKLDIIQAKKLHEDNQIKVNHVTKTLNELSVQYNKLASDSKIDKEIRKGDKVFLMRHHMTGTVSEINGEYAKVITEFVTFNVKLSEINPVNDNIIKKTKKTITLDLKETAIQFSSTLDIRGQAPHLAILALEEYLDKAILANVKEVRIIHGKGTGVLKNQIHNSLKKLKYIEEFKHPEPEYGGLGTTIIILK